MIESRRADSSLVSSSSLSERMSTFSFASYGMELTEVPPSIWPRLKVVRGLDGTFVLMKRIAPRTSALMGLGMPKSDQLWPPGPVMRTSRRREASALVVTWSVPEPSRTTAAFRLRAIGVDESAHAAEIAFALFADVGDEKNGAARLDSGFVNGAGDGDEAGEAGSVVGDAGRVQAVAVAADFNFGAWRENGVEMRGEHHDFFVGGAGEFADDVAGFVDRDVEAAVGEDRFHGFSARGFLKRRRGNFGDVDLLVVDPAEIAREPIEAPRGLRGIRVSLAGVSGAMRRADGANGHDRKDNAKKEMFHRGVPNGGREILSMERRNFATMAGASARTTSAKGLDFGVGQDSRGLFGGGRGCDSLWFRRRGFCGARART